MNLRNGDNRVMCIVELPAENMFIYVGFSINSTGVEENLFVYSREWTVDSAYNFRGLLTIDPALIDSSGNEIYNFEITKGDKLPDSIAECRVEASKALVAALGILYIKKLGNVSLKDFGFEAFDLMGEGLHSWDAGIIIKEPTYDEEGVKEYTCSICNSTKTEPISALTPEIEEPTVYYEQEPNSSQYSATPLIVGEPCIGEIGSYEFYRKNGVDTDFYAVYLEKGQYYRLYINGYNDEFAATTLIIHFITSSNVSKSIKSKMENLGVDYYEFTAQESGTYYIKLYNYFDNKTRTEHYYTINVEKIAPPTITLSKTELIYDGYSQRPEVTVKLGNRELKNYSDYDIDYDYTRDVGTYSIIITMDGDFYGTYSKTYKIVYATPTLSSAANVVGGVKFTWQEVNGAAKYRVFRRVYNASTKKWTSWAKVADTTAVSYTDKTVKSGTKYAYTVRCISSDGKTYTSNYNTTGKTVTYVAAPVISSITNINGGVKIVWPKTAGAAKYRVFRKTGSGSWTKLADTASVAYTDTKAANGTTYSYTIRCLNSTGSYVSAYNTTGKKITYVARPTISSLTSPKTKQMLVKWGKNAKATGYVIQYSTSSTFASGNKTVTVKGAATVSKTISSLTAKKRYYVRIRTYKTVGGKNYYSVWSAVKNVTTK